MEKTIICPVGDRPEAIYPALREFSVKHVHMLTHPSYARQAMQMKTDLKKFGIPVTEAKIGHNVWEETFMRVMEFAKEHPTPQHVVVHVGTGDREMQCAATSASYVSGLRAVNGNKDMIMGLPIMKFSYYTVLQERKLKIMETLAKGRKSLTDISKELRLSLSLLSYHVHGNRKSEGLVEMGLVELDEENNQAHISLTAMGRLLLKGYIPECEVC